MSSSGDGSGAGASWRAFVATLRRDARSATRAGGGWLHALIFFAVFAGLTAFAVGPERARLAAAGPPLMWLAALLAFQFAASGLFERDCDDGSLRALAAEQDSLGPYIAAKLALLLALTAGPIVAAAPVFFVMLALDPQDALAASLIFAMGAPALALATAAAAAVAAGLRAGGMFGAIIAAPLCVPTLIFGVGASVRTLETGALATPELALLGAVTLVYLAALPPFAISALRVGLE